MENELKQQDEGVVEINQEDKYEKPLGWFMKSLCYGVALGLVLAILYGFSGIFADILTNIFKHEVSRMKVITGLSIIFFIFKLTINLGNHWRSAPQNEIGTAVTNFPNPFYDPSYKEGPIMLQRQYKDLHTEYKTNKALLKQSQKINLELQEILEQFYSKVRVLLRHNENSNRLLKSLNYLYSQSEENGYIKRLLRATLNECITILEKDQSDKSISLFKVQGEDLKIIESVRINAESVDKRVFKKGEGFAGYVWENEKSEIVNVIEEDDERFDDQGVAATPIGSIMGIPLTVDEQIIGVLCLQSETIEGFSEADLRTVEFYARLCTFLILHDKIINKESVWGGNQDDRS
ncbi:GAF domain-containing protein [Pseudobacillus sp. 179-B 2D1 NHS]|uniref:GAF domain-containing protein n=1 Tax=Pseudobacillus sp. 179-B 2D1 NHS TaxID=3374292 RepID=UPI003879ABE3